MLKNNKGITLIALVITIIVLLILAGVSIAMLTGTNGVLTRATDASDETTRAGVADKVNMAIQAAYIDHVKAGTEGALQISSIVAQYNADNKTTDVPEPASGDTTTIQVKENGVTYDVALTSSGSSYTTSTAQVSVHSGT